ncbi:hypothetical protein SLNSH_00230 [Alsobacter soli]|uniref:Uncharacterized protein n=1 Tax=Alsobacter soli TaxID=2109933 RepID=A0A2T1HYS6_9HYPH|nr:hypothetical protein [Alsobacter soli]PSC06852.1 hypothetical protein SLNSH_00230 [Alsobacter soli]
MSRQPLRPVDVARRLSQRGAEAARSGRSASNDAWKRETFTLPREEAREKAREAFSRFPKAAYMTEIEWWRELDDGRIEFTIRRLPTAD